MRRILWFDPDHEAGVPTPIHWWTLAMLLATLFFNVVFVNAQAVRFWLFCSPAVYAVIVGCVAIVVAAVFFVAPAARIHAVGKPLFAVIEDSLGRMPAFAVRICAVVFLVCWMAVVVALPLRLWSNNLDSQLSSMEQWSAAAAIVAFLFVTGSQTMRTLGKLATFTNKLGVAILIAALFRVRDGWPAVTRVIASIDEAGLSELWTGTSELCFYVAPVGLLCATFAYRMGHRRDVTMAGLTGVAIPIFVSLSVVAVIGTATHASALYQPSLQPTVAMALWSHTARSAVGGRILVAAVTIFGAVRLGSRLLSDALVTLGHRTWQKRLMEAVAVAAIAWLSLHPFASALTATLDWSARCLGVASAVITAELLAQTRHPQHARNVIWTGALSAAFGLATPMYVSHGPLELSRNPWWHPWLLPSFVVAFTFCIGLKFVQRIAPQRLLPHGSVDGTRK